MSTSFINELTFVGWPFAFTESTFIASPLVYDINTDGLNEVVVTTQNGEIVFIR
jgi:hypothetical protein